MRSSRLDEKQHGQHDARDADWNRLETRIARARAVVEFLDPILK